MNEAHTTDIALLLDNFAESFIVIDTAGTIRLFNKKAQQVRYLDIERLAVGINIFGEAPSDQRKRTRWIIDDVIDTGRSFTQETEYRDSANGSAYFEISYHPLIDPEGQIHQVCITLRDITKQKIFENKISQVYKDLTSLIANANAIIFGIDSRGYVTEWNAACSRLTGYTRDDAYTKKVTSLIIDEKNNDKFQALTDDLLKGNSISNYELSITTRYDTEPILLLSATPRMTTAGQVVGAFFVGQDVTELTAYKKSLEKKVEERTRELSEALIKEKEVTKMKSRFVSIASHEFRTPLASINFTVGFIKKYITRISGEEINSRLESIEQNVHHMTALLNDVLTIGKTEAGKIMVAYSTIDLHDFMQKIVDEVMHSTKYSHQINLSIHPGVDIVTSDEKLLRNIFINLLTNAIKFSPQRKSVTFDIEDKDRQLYFKIKDEGIGIKADELDKVFEPFQRASNTGEIQGTGLGLSIVKKAVEMLNGKITVTSTPGQGSDFTVTLPL